MFSGRGPAGLRPRLLGSYSCQQDSGLLVPSWHTGVPVCWGRDRSRPTQVTGWGAHIPGSHPDVCSESWGTAGASCRRPCLPTCSHVFSGPMQEEELLQLLARHCYVRLGASLRSEAVQELLPSCVPSRLYKTKPPEKWASLVTAAHAKVSLGGAWAHGVRPPSEPRGVRRVKGWRPPAGQRETLTPSELAASLEGGVILSSPAPNHRPTPLALPPSRWRLRGVGEAPAHAPVHCSLHLWHRWASAAAKRMLRPRPGCRPCTAGRAASSTPALRPAPCGRGSSWGLTPPTPPQHTGSPTPVRVSAAP